MLDAVTSPSTRWRPRPSARARSTRTIGGGRSATTSTQRLAVEVIARDSVAPFRARSRGSSDDAAGDHADEHRGAALGSIRKARVPVLPRLDTDRVSVLYKRRTRTTPDRARALRHPSSRGHRPSEDTLSADAGDAHRSSAELPRLARPRRRGAARARRQAGGAGVVTGRGAVPAAVGARALGSTPSATHAIPPCKLDGWRTWCWRGPRPAGVDFGAAAVSRAAVLVVVSPADRRPSTCIARRHLALGEAAADRAADGLRDPSEILDLLREGA